MLKNWRQIQWVFIGIGAICAAVLLLFAMDVVFDKSSTLWAKLFVAIIGIVSIAVALLAAENLPKNNEIREWFKPKPIAGVVLAIFFAVSIVSSASSVFSPKPAVEDKPGAVQSKINEISTQAQRQAAAENSEMDGGYFEIHVHVPCKLDIFKNACAQAEKVWLSNRRLPKSTILKLLPKAGIMWWVIYETRESNSSSISVKAIIDDPSSWVASFSGDGEMKDGLGLELTIYSGPISIELSNNMEPALSEIPGKTGNIFLEPYTNTIYQYTIVSKKNRFLETPGFDSNHKSIAQYTFPANRKLGIGTDHVLPNYIMPPSP